MKAAKRTVVFQDFHLSLTHQHFKPELQRNEETSQTKTIENILFYYQLQSRGQKKHALSLQFLN